MLFEIGDYLKGYISYHNHRPAGILHSCCSTTENKKKEYNVLTMKVTIFFHSNYSLIRVNKTSLF